MDQVSNADQTRASGLGHNGRRDYNRYLRARSGTLPFDRLITSMLRVHSAREILAALHGRYSWWAIGHWRAGRRRPPAWVIDRLVELIHADAAALVDLASQVELQRPPGTDERGLAALRRVNAARKTGRRMEGPFPEAGEPSETKETGD